MQLSDVSLYDRSAFEKSLSQGTTPRLPLFKTVLKSGKQSLFNQFEAKVPIEKLVTGHAQFIDEILCFAWEIYFRSVEKDHLALIAVGGYGRGELLPYSDVDLLILVDQDQTESYRDQISEFITFLWDIGLEIGSSVRTLQESASEAAKDITIATNIFESRLIAGSNKLFASLTVLCGPENIWPSREFFEKKWEEQKRRHTKFHNTAYNLEPNVKESPGGLRDIQMIGWVAKRHFGDKTLHDLVTRGFLTENEYQDLIEGQAFIWRTRFALHQISGRREDRLLFEHQREIAARFEYRDQEKTSQSHRERASDGHRLGVELFMKQYYRTVMDLSRLNEMLLQHYQEEILLGEDVDEPHRLNSRFQSIKGFIEVKYKNVFQHYPYALLEIFLLLQQNAELKGVRASTIRLIRQNLHLIDEDFRNDLRCRSLFMEIFRQPEGLTHELRRMSTYGVLAKYIPAFGRIVGQMQFDLFHIYTVDQHILFVIRNLRRFFIEQYHHEFPLCSEIIKTLPKPELLYLAALFHDIAKGRGGDHSTLGEADAREFCLHHMLSNYDADLVAWLVKYHLLMSAFAQHKDLSDPDVIQEFAEIVENNIKLDYLYLLTVADMRATNTDVWNSWKDALLKTLRRQTKIAFSRGLDNPIDIEEKISQNQNFARAIIETSGIDKDIISSLWNSMGDEYFLRYTPQEVARQTQAILENPEKTTIIHVEPIGTSGGTDIFIRTPISRVLFANTTAVLDNLRLNIVEAKIVSSKNQCALNTFTVLELDGNTVTSTERLEEIKSTLERCVPMETEIKFGKVSSKDRRIENFANPTEISFVDDIERQRTTMEIVTTDRLGLLSQIAHILLNNQTEVSTAKICTLGAQVDDVFFVQNYASGGVIDEAKKQNIRDQLTAVLDKL